MSTLREEVETIWAEQGKLAEQQLTLDTKLSALFKVHKVRCKGCLCMQWPWETGCPCCAHQEEFGDSYCDSFDPDED